jgi:hypothetical protein
MRGYDISEAPKQHRGGHKFKDDYEVEAVVTWWLITHHSRASGQQGKENRTPHHDECLNCDEDWSKISGKEVRTTKNQL